MTCCPDCKGFGLVEVPQPNGDREALDCETCWGRGVLFDTDQEIESARIAGITYGY